MTAEARPRRIRTAIAAMASWFDGSHVEMVDRVADAGFPAFEALGAGQWDDREAVRRRCAERGIRVGAISGGGTINADGPVNPDYHKTFEEQIRAAVSRARELGAATLVGLAGQFRPTIAKEAQIDALAAAGRRVAPLLADNNMVLVWETLNVKVNHPGYALVSSADGAEVVRRTGSAAVRFLFDIYHQQISEGDVIRNIQTHINEIGHFHFADNPGRHEPGTGELNYRGIFRAIHETGYRGIVAAEFRKLATTEAVLDILADCDAW